MELLYSESDSNISQFDIGTQIAVSTRDSSTQYKNITVRSFGVQTGTMSADAQTHTENTRFNSEACETEFEEGRCFFFQKFHRNLILRATCLFYIGKEP